MSQSWFWPAVGQGQGSKGLVTAAGLLVGGLGPDTVGCRTEVVLGLVST